MKSFAGSRYLQVVFQKLNEKSTLSSLWYAKIVSLSLLCVKRGIPSPVGVPRSQQASLKERLLGDDTRPC